MSGVLQDNCWETCRNVSLKKKKKPLKKFTKKNSLTRQMLFSERLQQLLINKKIFDEVAVDSRGRFFFFFFFVLFFEVIILIYL